MVTDTDNTLVVMPQGKRSLAHILHFASGGTPFSWVYLGKNVSHFLELEKKIGALGKNIPISELLQGNARKYRQDYIDYLGSCAVESRDPWWYLTSISEKNSYNSDLYLQFCYLKTFFDVIELHTGRIFVICENSHLIRSIRENSLDNRHIEIFSFCDAPHPIFNSCWLECQKIKNKFIFVMRFIIRVSLAKALKRLCNSGLASGTQKPIVIHSWADHRSFSNDNHYHDIYFGNLAQKIEEIPHEYFFLIDILPTILYPLALKKVIGVRKPWHLFEEYLSLSDIIDALVISSRITKTPVSNKPLLNLNISDLLRDGFFSDRQNTRAELSYLYYAAGKRIAKIHKPASVCYTFENHIWEKMLIKGIKEVSDTTRIIGYAHSTVNTLELSYSLSPREKEIVPLPDSILVNGKKPKKVLMTSGFEEYQIHIVGSLRYGNLCSLVPEQTSWSRKKILVILSADINRSLEMMSKCSEAFKTYDGVSVIFKPHPIQKISDIVNLVQQLPEKFRVSTEPLSNLLQDTDVAIYTDSTASVEAVARGIPILQIKSDFLIDIDIFEESRIFRSVSSPEQIQYQTDHLRRSKNKCREEYREAICDLFSPVDDTILMQEIACDNES